MAEPVISIFDPLPPQRALILSKAKIRGYGGAMGGGKSRAGCEVVFDNCLDNPGLLALVCRSTHTSITTTTKRTMLNQVIPQEVITRRRDSNGQDWVQLWNGSTIHFVGLDDPYRWYSSEIGLCFFDEAQEIEEEKVLRIITRLRQRCTECERMPTYDEDGQIIGCPHMPNRAVLTFNPGNPGHWLQRWFIEGGEQTEHGSYKPELWMKEATKPLGDAEFFFAKASDNIHLPPDYVDSTLGGMEGWMRRRYLEGLWEFISGNSFFDTDALRFYQKMAEDSPPLFNGTTKGSITDDVAKRLGKMKEPSDDPVRIDPQGGPLSVWKRPVRDRLDPETGLTEKGHRYVVSVDASSGRGEDYSAIQVIDIDTFEQVAEWQGKTETGLVADQCYRIGRLYNDAVIVCELTGGWGLAIDQVLKKYAYPRLYTRRVIDRLSQKWTDRTGFDTTVKMRAVILSALEQAIREKEFGLYSLRAVNELGTFVWSDKERAEAQPGCHDDLVMALAIGVKVAGDFPREIKSAPQPQYDVTLAAAGF